MGRLEQTVRRDKSRPVFKEGIGGLVAPSGIIWKSFRGSKIFNGQKYNAKSEIFWGMGDQLYVASGGNLRKYGPG